MREKTRCQVISGVERRRRSPATAISSRRVAAWKGWRRSCFASGPVLNPRGVGCNLIHGNPSACLPCGLGRSRPKSSSKELAREVMDGSAVSVGPHAGMISKEVLQSLFPARAVPRRILHGLVLREDQDCLDRNACGVWLAGYGSPGGPVIALNSRPHRH